MAWKQLLAYIAGSVDQELLLRNEYLVVESRCYASTFLAWQRLRDGERLRGTR